MMIKELKGTQGTHELNIEDFAYKYIEQNRKGYNSTNMIYEDDVMKISAPLNTHGVHSTLYCKCYEDKMGFMLDLQGELLWVLENILKEEFLYKLKNNITINDIFKEE